MPVLLLLLAAMAVEITVLVLVGGAIGALPTVLLLVAASLAGMALLRREGARTMAAIVEATRAHRAPHRELSDGVFIAVAGVLVLIPGFVSDVLALALLLPPTRAVVRRLVGRIVMRAGRAARRRVVVVDADFEVHDDGSRGGGRGAGPTILLPGDDR